MNGKIKQAKGDYLFQIINYIFLFLCFILVSYPLLYIVSASLSDSEAVIRGDVWLLPVGFDLRAYEEVLKNDSIVSGYINSIIYTFFGTIFNLVLTILVAYPLSRKKLYGKGPITWFFLITMFFSGGLIPTYIQMESLGINNTRWVIILLGGISIYNMLVMRSFFSNTLPEEIYEAANLDGCGDMRTLISIVLPLSKPIIAVMVLYYAVGHWNDYFKSLIYLSNPELSPLQLVLRELLVLNKIDGQQLQSATEMANRAGVYELLRYAVIVVASIPVLVIYPFVQKYFVKGVMIGSVKG